MAEIIGLKEKIDSSIRIVNELIILTENLDKEDNEETKNSMISLMETLEKNINEIKIDI